MEIKLAQRIVNLAPSATQAMGRKARELQARGIEVLNLSVGEPDFPPDDQAKEAVLAAVRENFSRYTDSRGTPALRTAICRRTKEDLGLEYTPDQVVVSCGSKHSLYNLFQSLLDPGDEVLVPLPYWTSYPEMVKLAGGRPVFVSPGEDFKVTPENLAPALTGRTRCLLLNSPSNPSGVVYRKAELEALARWAVAKNLLVISDDAYQYFVYPEEEFFSVAGFPGMRERTIIVGAASKTYAMTGWRIGWFLAPEAIASAVAKLQDQSTSNPSSLAQRAAEAALQGDQRNVAQMREAFLRRRQTLLRELSGFSFPFPAGAFYLFFTHPAIRDSAAVAERLLEEQKLALVPGVAFGMEGYLRLSYAVSEEVLARATERIKTFFPLR